MAAQMKGDLVEWNRHSEVGRTVGTTVVVTESRMQCLHVVDQHDVVDGDVAALEITTGEPLFFGNQLGESFNFFQRQGSPPLVLVVLHEPGNTIIRENREK